MANGKRKPDGVGFGLVSPLRRRHDDYDAAGGVRLVKSCVENVLGTPAFGFGGKIGGTYPWRMDFGSWVAYLRHANMYGEGGDLGTVYAAEAIARWEPRAAVRLGRSGQLVSEVSGAMRIRIYFGLAEDLGGDILTGSLDETFHEVAV